MQRRLYLAGVAATGGLLTTAFLQAAVAAADGPGADAFTIGGYIFDPQLAAGGEGFDPVTQVTTSPPLLELGGGIAFGELSLAPQDFEAYNPATGADLGSVETGETITSLFGLPNGEFTVTSVNPADGATDANLPTVGSVYDVFNLGNGYENVYTATPDVTANGTTTPGTVTDTFVTPYGDDNLSSLFGSVNAANPLNPADAFTGLETGSIHSPDMFSIGGYTLQPLLTDQLSNTPSGGVGFDTIPALVAAPPLLEIGGGSLNNPAVGGQLATQFFDVLNSSGASIGQIDTGIDVTNLLGLTNTELVVADGSDAGQGIPSVGTVLDAFNLGNGYENVYVATPDVTTNGVTTPGTVTDTLVTPSGDVNLSSLFSFNAANPLDPGDALTGLHAGDSAIGADAFTIGGTTFDPTLATGGEGFDPVNQLIGAPPLLDLGGGTLTLFGFVDPLSTQSFNVYDGTATTDQIGTITTDDQASNLLGFFNTEFTVTGGTLAADAPSGALLPADGTVYDVLNFGAGYENVYTAIPGVDGAASQVSDILTTPFGNVNLSDLFGGIDATAALNPGDAFTGGLDVAAAAAATTDPLTFLGL